MCSNVFMGNTKHITVRMPESLVEVIDGRAEREKRSRSQVVVLGLQSEFGVSAEGVKSGSGELETQQAAVVDRLSASRPTLKVSNPSSPTKIYVEGVKGERDGRDNGAAKVQDLPQRSERTPRPGKRESSQVGVQEVPRATASGRPETHRQTEPDTAAESVIDRPDRPVCGFEAYNSDDGETYRCELSAHGYKVKHGAWRKL